MIFRFDDVCANTDMEKLIAMSDFIRERFKCLVQYSVSLLINDTSELRGIQREFVFLPIYKAYSDHRNFFKVDAFAYPRDEPSYVKLLSHGLVHVNHQMLCREAQEMSILISCSLIGTDTFVPPFNKWNMDTESICREHGLHLQKFEDGWLGVEHNAFKPQQQLWYTHSRNMTLDELKAWAQ